MLYNKNIFQQLCRDMGLELDYSPDYNAAIESMKVFYPAITDDFLQYDSFFQDRITISRYPRVTFSYTTSPQKHLSDDTKYLPNDTTLDVA